MLGDFFGRLGRLGCKRLHLGSHDSESFAGFASARCFDGGIQCKQIGLSGDRLNQAYYFADAAGRGTEL